MGIYGDLQKLNETQYVARQQLPDHPTVAAGDGERFTPTASNQAPTPPRPRGVTIARHHATKRGITRSRYHDTIIQTVRTAVKHFGKEAATHRFTVAEKRALADIVYTYKQGDIRTSENEITRIGVNFLIRDYRENGEHSLLHRVLKALNS